jgi:hypothetical protein
MPKPKLFLLALVLAALLLAFPVAAQATLAHVTDAKVQRRASSIHVTPSRVVIAADNGSNPQTIEQGNSPHVSPDGLSVAYLHEGGGHAQELRLALAAGGPLRTLRAAKSTRRAATSSVSSSCRRERSASPPKNQSA